MRLSRELFQSPTKGPTAAATPKNSGAGQAKNAHKGQAKKGHKGKTVKTGRKGQGARVKGGAGTVSLVDVTPSVSDGSTTEVSGVSPGAAVVVAGQTYLAAGDAVRVTATVTVPTSVTGSSVGGILTAPSASPTKTDTGAGAGAGAGAAGGGTGKGGAGGAG